MRAIFIFLLGAIIFFAIGCEKDEKKNTPIEFKVQELLSKMIRLESIPHPEALCALSGASFYVVMMCSFGRGCHPRLPYYGEYCDAFKY